MPEELIGTVTHYFAKPEVGIVKLKSAVAIGDRLHFRGHTTDFQQQLDSMQVDHAAVQSAAAGDEVAFKVAERVREGDEVFRVS